MTYAKWALKAIVAHPVTGTVLRISEQPCVWRIALGGVYEQIATSQHAQNILTITGSALTRAQRHRARQPS